MPSHAGRLRALTLGASIAVTCGALTACGSSSDSGGPTTAATGAAQSSGASGCVAQAKRLVDSERAPMPLILPSKSFDMSANRGKTIWFISPSQATGYALGLSKAVVRAGEAAGMKVVIFDGKGQPDRFTQGFNQAVAQKADGIVDYAIDPALVPAALDQVKSAGIPVLAMSTGKPAPANGPIFESINTDVKAEGRYMADYAAFATGCKVDGATTFDPTYATLVTEHDSIAAELAKLCPDTCKTQDQQMKLASMATDLGPSTQSLIQRNPDLNTIFATFDQAATYQMPAVEQSGSDAKIVGTNGLPPNLDAVRKGTTQIADISYVPTEYFGWLAVDQLGRAMQGEATGDQNGDPFVMPVQTFDKSNLPASDDVADLFPKLASYESAFRSKWGM